VAEVKASDVKALREKTGAGMMDCKEALDATGGDFAKAEKLLKEKGLAAVEKRIGRATNEGKIFVKNAAGKSVVLELTCETDFVARNADFIALGEDLAKTILEKGYTSIVDPLSAKVTELASKIRENMSLKRFAVMSCGAQECVHEYLHGDKLGVLVKFKADKPSLFADEKVKAFIHDVALHIAAFNPSFAGRGNVAPDYIKEQEEIFLKQIQQDEKMKSKPENVLKGIIQGKLTKHLADICLMDQGFVKDEKQTVAKMMAQVAKDAGGTLEIVEFLYYRVGA
jgi:elongation factor Ts